MFEKTEAWLKVPLAIRYGPGKIIPVAAPVMTGHGVGYAPTSWTWSSDAARIVPSLSKASLAVPCSCRAVPAHCRFSRRSSIHLTAAGSFRAASRTQMSSRSGTTFCPKPPPTSRVITRTLCSGMPSSRAANIRTSCGAWVPAQTVSSPLPRDHSTTRPRVSIGTALCACSQIVSLTTCAAQA